MSIVAAVIILQTLPFKFSGAELPVYIFTTLDAEPVGASVLRLSVIVGVALLVPRTAILVPLAAWSYGRCSGGAIFTP